MKTNKSLLQKCCLLAVVPALSAASVIGCTKKEASVANDAKEQTAVRNPIYNNQPVTIKVRTNSDTVEVWEKYTVEPVKKKFPNVTLERVEAKPSLEERIALNDVPDIILATPAEYVSLRDLNLPYDLTETVAKNKYDMSRFGPSLVEAVKKLDDKVKLPGIPFRPTKYGLLYSKNVFDKFAVAYPADAMTWDQVIELAKKVTRSDAGIQYRGLSVQTPGLLYTQLSQTPVVGDKAVVTTPQWQLAAQTWKRIHEIAGNNHDLGEDLNKLFPPFSRGEVAMMAVPVGIPRMITVSEQYPDLNWDVSAFPTFKEAPETDTNRNYQIYVITNNSKVKEEAFEVISYLMSDEVQRSLSREGYVTSLNNKDIQNLLAVDVPLLKNKKISNLFKYDKEGTYTYSRYLIGSVTSPLSRAFTQIKNDQTDINSALRTAEEEMNKAIDTLKVQFNK